MNPNWDQQFLQLFHRSCDRYQSGNEDWTTYFSPEEMEFLASIGYRPREMFDYVEDFCNEGVPTPETALLIAAARRDYFLHIQKGKTSAHITKPDELPAKSDDLEGIVWLPRIIAKARGKLRGELDPNTMFSCGGDRAFLSKHQLHAADFLRVVWSAGDKDESIICYVKARGEPQP